MKLHTSKKGQSLAPLQGATAYIVAIVLLIVVVVVGASVLQSASTSLGSTNGTDNGGDAAHNLSTTALDSYTQFGDNFTVIVVIGVAVILITLIMGFAAMKIMGGN